MAGVKFISGAKTKQNTKQTKSHWIFFFLPKSHSAVIYTLISYLVGNWNFGVCFTRLGGEKLALYRDKKVIKISG